MNLYIQKFYAHNRATWASSSYMTGVAGYIYKNNNTTQNCFIITDVYRYVVYGSNASGCGGRGGVLGGLLRYM